MSYPHDVDRNNELQFATQWRRFLPFIVGGAGIVMIVVGLGYTYINRQTGESVESGEIEMTQGVDSVKGVQTVKLIKVDISGAVIKPGLVEIPADSRVQDVLISAGGYDAKANRNYISRYINLAQPLQDGMKIYVPFEDENSGGSGGTSQEMSSGYNINSSSQSKLEELPGVGPVTAKKIIEGRPYGSTEELLSKKVVSKSVYEKIKQQVNTY